MANTNILAELKSDHLNPGEKYKKLNDFLLLTDRQQLESILSSLQGKTDIFSSRIKIEIAVTLKSNPDIIIQEAFLSEHTLLLGRGLRCKWIFENESPLSNVGKLSEVIQSVSYVCRVKLIGRLGRYLENESKAEEIYTFLENSYGLRLASPLLPKCSSEFIRKVLTRNEKLNLRFRQMCQLENRGVHILMEFLNKRMEEFKAAREFGDALKVNKYNKILTRILKNHPEEFITFYEKYGNLIDQFSIGSKSTKRILKHFPSRITSAPEKFAESLCTKQISKFLTTESLGKIFAKIFPKKLSTFQYTDFSRLVEWSPFITEGSFWEAFKIGFTQTYDENIEDFLQEITPDILQYIPVDERIKIADLKIANARTDDYYQHGYITNPGAFWLRFHPTEVSIPKIKEFLNGEGDADKRAEIIVILVDNCAVNKDKVSFREICGWVVERYRNDSHSVLSKFLEAIFNNITTFSKFIKDWNWDAFGTLFSLCIQSPTEPHPPQLLNLLMMVIRYRVENDLPVTSLLPTLVYVGSKLESLTIPTSFDNSMNRIPSEYLSGKRKPRIPTIFEVESRLHQIKLINLISAALEKKFPETVPIPVNCLNLLANLLKTIGCWNKAHREQDPILVSDIPWLMNHINEFMVKSYSDTSGEKSTTEIHIRLHIMEYLNKQSDMKNTYFKEYLRTIPDVAVIEFNHGRSPKTVLENLESILDFNSNDYNEVPITSSNRYMPNVKCISQISKQNKRRIIRFFECLPYNGYLGLADDAVKQSCSKIAAGKPKSTMHLNLLSVLDPRGQYLQLMEGMYPNSTSKINSTSNSDAAEEYSCKMAIAGSLQYVTPASIGLPVVGRFCTGDYLKLTLGSLDSLCLKSNAEDCRKFLQPRIDQPAVSIKKHAIRLFCTHKTKNQILDLLVELWKKETHASIRHVIFQQAVRIMANTDAENQKPYWDFVQSLMSSLVVTDKVVLRQLVGINFSRRARNSGNIMNQIPLRHFATYFEICLEKFKMIRAVDDAKCADALFSKMTHQMDVLPEAFLRESVVQQIDFVLTQEEANFGVYSGLNKFVTKFLFNCSDEKLLVSRLETIGKAISNLKKDMWDLKGKQGTYPARQIAKTVLDRICYSSLSKPEDCSRSIVGQVLEYFCEKFRIANDRKLCTDFFNEFILLQLSKILHAQKAKDDWTEVAGKIVELVNFLVAEYHGEIIIGPFCTILKTFMGYYDEAYGKGSAVYGESDDEGRVTLADGLLKSENPPRSAVIVAASVLPNKCPSKPWFAKKYTEAQQILQNWPDETVQIFLAMS